MARRESTGLGPMYDPVTSGSNEFQPPILPRPILSTLDTWDQSTQVDYQLSAASKGRRPLWNVPSIAVTSEPVNTIRSSAFTRYVSPSQATVAGMTENPTTDLTIFKVMPNMSQSLYVDSEVQVTWSAVIATAIVPDTVTFVIFRDGKQISQLYYQSTAAQGLGHSAQVLASGSYVDTRATMRTFHVYDLRWRRGNSKAFAFNKNRTFQASNLRAL